MTRILLAEDNQGDVFLVQCALSQHGIEHERHLAADGEEAATFLSRSSQPGECCYDLVLLDLNLPKVDGSEILARLRKQSQCAETPVIVIGFSNEFGNGSNLAQLKIHHYFKKPTDLDEFMKLGAVVQLVLSGHSP
jgi:DNA-binding response OmpR family regulator